MWRNLLLSVALLGGCGSSAMKVRAAENATYRVDPRTLLAAAAAAVRDTDYEIVGSGTLAFAATPVDYLAGPNGRPDALSTAYVVRVIPAGDTFKVTVTVQDYLYGKGLTQSLDRLDANVDDRVNTLSKAIYEHAKRYASR